MKKTTAALINELEEHINQIIKMMSDVERVMLEHERALTVFKSDIAELKRKQKNLYGVV